MRIAPYDLIGFAGSALLIGAYFANQQRWLSAEDWRFPTANLAGSALIFVSLFYEWNFPSVVIEIFWAAISVWGIIKSLSRR
jgi:hypothetical protein